MATDPVSMLTNLPTSDIKQQVTSTSQETVFSSSSCCETVVAPNTSREITPSIFTSQRSDLLNPLRSSGTLCQNSPRHYISLGEMEPASEQIQQRVKHMLCSSELSFEQGCDFRHKINSDPVTNKTQHNNFRSVTSLSDSSVHYSLENMNKDTREVNTPHGNVPELAANTLTNTNELAFFYSLNQHITSLKCVKDSTFRTAAGNLTTHYSLNSNPGETGIPSSSDTDNTWSCPASLAHTRKLWNFGCSHKKSDVICDTVDAWSNSRSGKLFLNLKQSLFGHMNHTEKMLIGGNRPLVFGGTYPIDVPLERNVEETVSNSDKGVSAQTFDIDAPCVGFFEHTLSSESVDSQNTVVRRNKTVSKQCTILGSSPELKHSASVSWF